MRPAPANGTRVKRRLALNRRLPALAVLAVLHAAGCRKPPSTPVIAIGQQIDPWPPRVGLATVTLQISAAGGNALTGARVKLEGDMAHPGMKPEFGDTSEIGPGRYQGRLAFTMPGDWVVLAHIALPGGQILDRQLEVKGVRAN